MSGRTGAGMAASGGAADQGAKARSAPLSSRGIILHYIKYSIPEFAICFAAALSLTINMVYGFRLTEQMRTSYGMFMGVTALVLALMFIMNYSRRSRTVLIPCYAAAAAAIIIACARMGISLLESAAHEENLGLSYVIVIIIAVISFVASRTRVGSGLFAVIGVIAHAWLCLLQYTFFVWALVVFIIAAGTMYLYARYRHQVINGGAKQHAFVPAVFTSAITFAAAVGVAAALFFGVVKPLDPPVLDISLITDYFTPDVRDVLMLNTVVEMPIHDRTGSDVDEDQEQVTDEMNDEMQDEDTPDSQDASPEDEASTTEDRISRRDETADTDKWSLMTLLEYPVMLIILICVIAVIAILAVRWFLLRHRRWLARIRDGNGRAVQIVLLYVLLRKKLKVIGISASPSESPERQADALSSKTKLMDEGGPTWAELSAIFTRVFYGGKEPDDEEYGKYVAFYGKFFKACRKHCGFKWLWKQFRL